MSLQIGDNVKIICHKSAIDMGLSNLWDKVFTITHGHEGIPQRVFMKTGVHTRLWAYAGKLKKVSID